MPPCAPVPLLLQARSTDEISSLPLTDADHIAIDAFATRAERVGRRTHTPVAEYVYERRATAATLRAIDAAHGGGFYDVDPEADLDADAALATFGDDAPVVDVQTHLVDSARWQEPSARALEAFLRSVDADRWSDGVDPRRIDAAAWASLVFGASETSVALLTSTPGPPAANVLTNGQIAATRDLLDRYSASGRVLTHAIVHPNLGEATREQMQEWHETLQPSGWKCYTLYGPPTAASPTGGWYLDDEEVGLPFLEIVQQHGPRVVAAHKGLGGPVPDASVAAASPRDIGPAARVFPGVRFVVYHSGYERDPHAQEGPYDATGDARGVDRLIRSCADAGIGPGHNVFAELGTTWFLMLRRPVEAAHVLGKLLVALGPDRVVWGTDSTWYGSPQPLIDAFRAFTIPVRMQEEFGYPPLTRETKRRILGANAQQLYGIGGDVIERVDAERDRSWVADAATELRRTLANVD